MLEEEFIVDSSNNSNEQSESENQIDRFSQTTKLLDKELKDKKDTILKVLEEGGLREIFENLLSSEEGELCVISLLESGNNEDEIKAIILANLPEGYAYNTTNEVVKTEVKKTDNFTGAIMRDKQQETVAQQQETVKQQQEKEKQIEAIMRAIEERDRLTDKYKNLDSITNANSDNYQTVKQQLENNGVLNQLKESGHDEQFINDYILVQTTLVELKSNPTSYEQSDISFFDKVVKNLNNACNIPDTNLSSFSSENIAQTRTELFDKDIGNESLIQARKNNIESHAEAYAEIFPEMGTDEVIAKYGKFLEGDLKEFWQQYESNRDAIKNKIAEIGIMIKNQQIFSENGKNYISDEEKLLFDNYKKMLSVTSEIKKDIENRTKNMMEEMCLISQIKGMYMCIGQEEGKDFNLNKANEIINDNGVLTLKGHIDGVDFSVSHDTINPNQRLKIKSKLGVDSEDQNTFEIGKEDNYVNSPFILPSQEEIFGVITKVVQSNDLSKSSDLPKYLESLQNSIVGRMDEVYKDAELAHHYITNKVKGEKILDNSLALIQGIKPNMQDLTKPINQGSNEKLHSFMKMIKFNVENSTTEEKNKLNKCLSKIPEIVDAYKTTKGVQNFVELKYPLIIENYLKNQTWLEEGNEDTKLGLVFDLFSYYNQNSKDTRANVESSDGAPSKMIIEDLYRDLFEFQSSQSLIATTRKNEETEKQDKQDADDELASIDWPPVPMAV